MDFIEQIHQKRLESSAVIARRLRLPLKEFRDDSVPLNIEEVLQDVNGFLDGVPQEWITGSRRLREQKVPEFVPLVIGVRRPAGRNVSLVVEFGQTAGWRTTRGFAGP